MTSIALLGDVHIGARNDLSVLHYHFEKFFELMISDLVERKVSHVFQLGDLFDRRKYINFFSLNESKRYFFNKLKQNNITLHVLVGNHDAHFRDSLVINSPSLVLGEYDNIVIYDKPTTVQIEQTTIDIIPWICKDNEVQVFDFIKNSTSDLCFGHFEIAGFAMYRGMQAVEGLANNIFEKYEHVFSGHYHTKSQKDNITYVGTPYEMTWQDYNDPKGYHVFSLDTRAFEFIKNPYTVFARIDYDDTKTLVNLDEIDVTNCFVKLVVVNKTDLYKFEQFTQQLYSKGAFEVKIVEDLTAFNEGEVIEEIDIKDTMEVLSKYIDSIETGVDKDGVKSFMRTLYLEAVSNGIFD